MADSFPSVGLKFDLSEVVRGQAALSALTASYADVAAAAQKAGAAVTQGATAQVATTKSAGAQMVAATKATKAAQVSEEQRAEETIQAFLYDRLVNEQRLREANLAANSRALAEEIAEEERAQALIEQMMLDRVVFDGRMRAAEVAAAKLAADAKAAEAAKAIQVEETTAAKVAAAQQRFLAGLQQSSATVGQGRAALAAYKAEELGVAAEAAPFIQKLREAEAAAGGVQRGSALATRELVVMGREIGRGDFSRLAGSFTLEAQALGLLTPEFLLGAAAVAAFLIPLAAVATAMEQGSEAAAKLQNSIQITGNYAGVTAGEVDAMAVKVAQSTGESTLSTKKLLEELVSTGKFTSDEMVLAAQVAEQFSRFTGQSAEKILGQFEGLKGGVVKFAVKWEEAYHDLTLAQIDEIAALEKSGKHHEAELAFFSDVERDVKTKTAPAYGYLAGAMHGVMNAARDMWAAIMGWGMPKSLDQQIIDQVAVVNKAAADINSGNVGHGGRGPNENDPSVVAARAATLNNAMTTLRSLQAQGQAERDKAAADAKKAQEQDDAIRRKYDTVGVKRQTGDGGAKSQIDQLKASVESLNAQLDQAASFNLSPLADDAAKINQAYQTTLAKFADSHNAKKQALADTAANLAADKEALTLILKLADANIKQAASETLKAQQISLSIAAITSEHAALNAYYADGTAGIDTYVRALAAQADAVLKAENDNADLAIAQRNGATSLDGISAALQKLRGVTKDRADQLQEEAIRTAEVTHEVNALTQAEKALAAQADAHTANLATIDDLTKEAAAYRAGAQAIVQYEQQKALAAGLKGSVLSTNTGNDLQDALSELANEAAKQQAMDDQHNIAVQTNVANVAKLNQAQAETLRLATLTTQERSVEAEVLARMHDLMAANAKLSEAEARAQATAAALAAKRLKDAADLKIQLQDSLEQTFIDTGKIDFKSIDDGIYKAARKALYEALIQKPIDIIINAAVNFETQAINSLLGNFLGGGGGSSSLASLFGGQGASAASLGQQFLGSWGSAGTATNAISGAASSLTGVAASLTSVIGPMAAVGFLAGGASSSIVKALGGSPAQQKTAGIVGTIAGLIPGLLSALFGDHSGHATAAVFNSSGQYVSNALSPKGSTQATIDAAGAIGNATQTLIAQFKAMGINADNVIKSIEQGTRNDARLFLMNGIEISSKNGDTAALQTNITKALYQYGTYTNAQEKVVVDQLLKMNATLDEINAAVQAFNQAQTDFTNVKLALLQFTDPTAYATQTLQQQQLDRRKTLAADINAGYFSQDQINQLAATLPQLEQKEIEQALAGVASAAGGAAHSLADFQTAQKKVIDFVTSLQSGALSPLSPAAQLEADKANFAAQSALAKGGNYDALQNITTVAQTYLTDAQKFFGSGAAYADVFNSVTAALTDVGTSSVGNSPADQTAAINAASAALQAAIKAQGLAIVGAINDNAAPQDAAAAAAEALAGINATGLAAIAQAIRDSGVYNIQLAGGFAAA